jgi:hypothetical protein
MNFENRGRMSAEELSIVLNISERTVKALAKNAEIPSVKEKNKFWFDFDKIMEHFKTLEGGAA